MENLKKEEVLGCLQDLKVESSLIAKIGMNDNGLVFIQFKKDNSIYAYKNVLVEEFEALRDAESVGKHFLGIFKNAHTDYLKLDFVGTPCESKMFLEVNEEELGLMRRLLCKEQDDNYYHDILLPKLCNLLNKIEKILKEKK